MSSPKPIPEGYSAVTPHLVIKEAKQAIEFYEKAFGAKSTYCMPGPDGESVMHAEIVIGGAPIMVAEEYPPYNQSPATLKGSPVVIHLYVEDTDALFEQATQAGAETVMPPADMFWGDRYAKVRDPFGHEWSIATHVEDVPPEQMAKRAEAFMAQMKG